MLNPAILQALQVLANAVVPGEHLAGGVHLEVLGVDQFRVCGDSRRITLERGTLDLGDSGGVVRVLAEDSRSKLDSQSVYIVELVVAEHVFVLELVSTSSHVKAGASGSSWIIPVQV